MLGDSISEKLTLQIEGEDGITGTVPLVMVKEGDEWKIDGFEPPEIDMNSISLGKLLTLLKRIREDSRSAEGTNL